MRRIGGSDIPMLLGISKHGNAGDVYKRIVEGADRLWSPQMQRGIDVEPDLRQYAVDVLGLQIEKRDSDYHIHPGNDFAHAQIDDIGEFALGVQSWKKPAVIDYKSQSTFAKGWGAAYSSVVPPCYDAQLRWEMACADRDVGLLITGFGTDQIDGTFYIANVNPYVIHREWQQEMHLLTVAREFWFEHVLPRVPPNEKPIAKYEVKEITT